MQESLPVKIIEGLSDRQVIQRRSDTARPLIRGLRSLQDAGMHVYFRLTDERSERAITEWIPVCEHRDGTWEIIPEIPVGGPYRAETCLRKDGTRFEDAFAGEMRRHFYVGDNYLIAGQSNAAGYAMDPVSDLALPGVCQLRLNGRWDMASHPINEGTGCIYANLDVPRTGHSPWLRFAGEMVRATGIPTGLIPSALGGSPMDAWVPGGVLYGNAMRMVLDAGGICGVLWYQGCSDAMDLRYSDYGDRFLAMVRGMRSDLDMPELPFYTCQLNGYAGEEDPAQDISWSAVRTAQEAAAQTDGVYMLATFGMELYDDIHNSASSNLIIGTLMSRMVRSTHFAESDPYTGLRAVGVRRIDGGLEIELGCVRGSLTAGENTARAFTAYGADGQIAIDAVFIRDGRIVLAGRGLDRAETVTFGQVRNSIKAGITDTGDGRVLTPFVYHISESIL
ncbi:MAG: hypothetical protein IJS22_09105 [Lachnospiraceae bacterium]|nr:hypothetical protein [Lachnospiraceae bacterium]